MAERVFITRCQDEYALVAVKPTEQKESNDAKRVKLDATIGGFIFERVDTEKSVSCPGTVANKCTGHGRRRGAMPSAAFHRVDDAPAFRCIAGSRFGSGCRNAVPVYRNGRYWSTNVAPESVKILMRYRVRSV